MRSGSRIPISLRAEGNEIDSVIAHGWDACADTDGDKRQGLDQLEDGDGAEEAAMS